MKLNEIMKEIKYQCVQGNDDIEIPKIVYDSRQTEENSVFVCVTGFKIDGHKFAQNAVEKGAAAIIVENDVNVGENITVLKVNNSRLALAKMAANYYDNPSYKLNLIGVTGTNGKTSTTYIIKSVLEKMNHKVGIIGTIENRIGERVIKTQHTTPESVDLQKILSDMNKEAVDDVVMEVSSHALDLFRVNECNFKIGIFTNLTQDHLDYHVTMENYKIAKGKLFQMAQKSVINIDDDAGEYMKSMARGELITTGIDNEADLNAKNINITAECVTFDLIYKEKNYPVKLNILGRFSIYNVLGSIGACLLLDIPIETIIEGVQGIKGVKGRFETIKSNQGFNAVVDYSHTPDSLENALKTAKEFVTGKIITVFGCGGDRDRTKRPIMGEIAGTLSDYCIITSDNPRSENPVLIIKDIELGIKKTGCKYEMIPDRRKAIFKGVQLAKEGDLIIVAGKGHETYQIFEDKTIHFDDSQVIREAFGKDK